MCLWLFLSIFWKTYVFSSKKSWKCLEGIEKTCTFALAFQNYGKRLRLRATRKSSLRRLHTTESSTRSDSYTLLYIGYGNWVEETNRSILYWKQEDFNKPSRPVTEKLFLIQLQGWWGNHDILQWRVWSWLRMNASYRLNTCKSRGNDSESLLLLGDDRRTGE